VDEMGRGACDRHGVEEKVLVGNLRKRVCLEALAVDGEKIFICISKTEDLMERTGLI
jgi:hypothetical protein